MCSRMSPWQALPSPWSFQREATAMDRWAWSSWSRDGRAQWVEPCALPPASLPGLPWRLSAPCSSRVPGTEAPSPTVGKQLAVAPALCAVQQISVITVRWFKDLRGSVGQRRSPENCVPADTGHRAHCPEGPPLAWTVARREGTLLRLHTSPEGAAGELWAPLFSHQLYAQSPFSSGRGPPLTVSLSCLSWLL